MKKRNWIIAAVFLIIAGAAVTWGAITVANRTVLVVDNDDNSDKAEYEKMQNDADNGRLSEQWRLDNVETAQEYAYSTLKWEEFQFYDYGDKGYVIGHDSSGELMLFKTVQPAKLGEGGIWIVESAEPLTQKVALYFADENAEHLVYEERTIPLIEDIRIEMLVCEEIIKGPENEALRPTVTDDVRVHSVRIDTNGICTVELSEEFAKNNTGGTAKETNAIYSIVNSLCSLDSVAGVKFEIAGQETPEFGGHFDMSGVFGFSEKIIKK